MTHLMAVGFVVSSLAVVRVAPASRGLMVIDSAGVTAQWSSAWAASGSALDDHWATTVGHSAAANFLVNRRMNKSQQMRWSRRGADLLLQVRCAVYNGTLGSGLGHRFQPHANQNERLANAA